VQENAREQDDSGVIALFPREFLCGRGPACGATLAATQGEGGGCRGIRPPHLTR